MLSSSRVYLETARLQNLPLSTTTCSLELTEGPWYILTQVQQNTEDQSTPDNPLIIERQQDRTGQERKLSEDDQRSDATAARKLIVVMAGFLFCWLPYFIWLPTSTLLVS